MLRSAIIAAASLAALCSAPAAAAKPAGLTLGAKSCGLGDIAPTASACVGWYEGNLNGGSAAMRADSAAALNALLGVNGFTASSLGFQEALGSIGGGVIDFATPLYGDTVFSVHVGAAKGQASGVGYQGTAFYRFDAGNLSGGLDTIGFNVAGLSNARLYSTGVFMPGVPEPATWAMLIAGFGVAGAALRRRPAFGAVPAQA